MSGMRDRILRALDSVDGRLDVIATIEQDSDGQPLRSAHLLRVEYRFDLADDYAEETITVGAATALIDEHAGRLDFIRRHTRRQTGAVQDIVRVLTDAPDGAADRMLAAFDGKALAFLTDVQIPEAADVLLGTVLDGIEQSFPFRTVGATVTLPEAWAAGESPVNIALRCGYQPWSGLMLRQKSAA